MKEFDHIWRLSIYIYIRLSAIDDKPHQLCVTLKIMIKNSYKQSQYVKSISTLVKYGLHWKSTDKNI